MSEFWLWFIRPLAEMLGAIAAVALVVGLVVVWQLAIEWRRRRAR